MKSSSLTAVAPTANLSHCENSIRHLPAAAQAAVRRFQSDGDLTGLDLVIFAILDDCTSEDVSRPIAALPDSTHLIADLGFDSLTLTEIVFLTEDIFGINVTNAEIIQVHTLADLRRLVKIKATSASGR